MDTGLERIAASLTAVCNVLDTSFDAQYDEVGVRVSRVDRRVLLVAALPVPVAGGLFVTVRGATERFRMGLGAEYTKTGDQAFDARFHVEATDPLSALPELTIPVRSTLLSLSELTREVTVVGATVRAGFLGEGAAIEGLAPLVEVARALRDGRRANL